MGRICADNVRAESSGLGQVRMSGRIKEVLASHSEVNFEHNYKIITVHVTQLAEVIKSLCVRRVSSAVVVVRRPSWTLGFSQTV